jgi:hypothetical protein
MTELKVGDRVRVTDGSADHWRVGVIDSICLYSGPSNHWVLLDGDGVCGSYSAYDLELVAPEPEPKSEFKVGDRVRLYPHLVRLYPRYGRNTPGVGVIREIQSWREDPNYLVLLDGEDERDGCCGYGAEELELIPPMVAVRRSEPHLPTKPSRGQHPKSLKNLKPRAGRGECKEVHLRLPLEARDWLLRQGKGRMSSAVTELIMERMEKGELSNAKERILPDQRND